MGAPACQVWANPKEKRKESGCVVFFVNYQEVKKAPPLPAAMIYLTLFEDGGFALK